MGVKSDYTKNSANKEGSNVKDVAAKIKDRENRYIEKKKPVKRALDYLVMTIGAIIYAAGISLFLDPNSLAPGGVTGISIILNRITNIETGTLILLLNIPILLVGTWRFGVRFILSTLYCIALTSLCTNVLSAYGPVTEDLVLAAVVGGAVLATGVGLVFKAGGTTGGIDIIIKLLRLKMPHLKTGALYLAMDAVVVATSAILFRNIELALYAGVAVFVSSTVLDVVLYGRDGAKLIYIISDHFEPITKRLLEELDLGVTHVDASGAYSGKEKRVIMCVCRKNLSPKVEEIVKEEDPLAFMIVSNATEIYGEGYKNIFSEKL